MRREKNKEKKEQRAKEKQKKAKKRRMKIAGTKRNWSRGGMNGDLCKC